MSRHITPGAFLPLPSGTNVHPCRLIHKDGTLMWKHALLKYNEFTQLPQTQAHESHILKTALRLEELNSWVSQSLDPWECLRPIRWYDPTDEMFNQGIAVEFTHTTLPAEQIIDTLKRHKQDHEVLTYADGLFQFQRC